MTFLKQVSVTGSNQEAETHKSDPRDKGWGPNTHLPSDLLLLSPSVRLAPGGLLRLEPEMQVWSTRPTCSVTPGPQVLPLAEYSCWKKPLLIQLCIKHPLFTLYTVYNKTQRLFISSLQAFSLCVRRMVLVITLDNNTTRIWVIKGGNDLLTWSTDLFLVIPKHYSGSMIIA